MRMRIVCVCSRIRYYIRLTHKQIVVFRDWLYAKFVNWCDCLNAGCSGGPAKESRGTLPTLPWHVTRQRWLLESEWKTREQGIVANIPSSHSGSKDIKTVPPSQCGELAYPLAESYWEFSSLDTRDTVDVCWCHLETLLKWSQWSKRKASHCIGIGTWCTWI